MSKVQRVYGIIPYKIFVEKPFAFIALPAFKIACVIALT